MSKDKGESHNADVIVLSSMEDSRILKSSCLGDSGFFFFFGGVRSLEGLGPLLPARFAE